MSELKQLHAGHASAVLAFELANRAYFAASISDRGDEFYDQFADRHEALLAEQEAGVSAFYVLVAEDGSVLGRFNLYDFKDGTGAVKVQNSFGTSWGDKGFVWMSYRTLEKMSQGQGFYVPDDV